MAEFIDRELALSMPFANDQYDHDHANEHFINGCKTYKEWLEQIPIADVVERQTGKWIYNPGGESEFDAGDFYICDQCGSSAWEDSNFCPNCGADMRGNEH